MNRFLSKVAVFLAALVLAAHSLFPHNHEEEDSLLAVEEVSILDLLSLVFEQDLGEGHLETYLLSANSETPEWSQQYVLLIFNIDIVPGIISTSQVALLDPDLYRQDDLIYQGPPRSPPLL